MLTDRQIANRIKNWLKGHEYYTNMSPRITHAEIEFIEKELGVSLQIEHTYGAQAGPIAVYPLRKEDKEIMAMWLHRYEKRER